MRPVGRGSLKPWAASAMRRAWAFDNDTADFSAGAVDPGATTGRGMSVGDVDGHRVDDDILVRAVVAVGRDTLHRIQHVEPLHDLAEQAVLRRQAGTVRPRDQEELAAIRVRAGIRHCHGTDLVLASPRKLVLELVARPA